MSHTARNLKYFTRVSTDTLGGTVDVVYNLDDAASGELIASVIVRIPQTDIENQTLSAIRAAAAESAPDFLSEILSLVQSGRAVVKRE